MARAERVFFDAHAYEQIAAFADNTTSTSKTANMATRARQQSAAPSMVSTATAGSTTLPTYEPPSFSLTQNAQRALAQLSHTHSLKKLDEHLNDAQATVSIAAADINDRVSKSAANSRKRKAREEENGVQSSAAEDAEKSLEELREKVERMTQRMEESMRKLIDGQHGVQSIKDSVNSTAEHVRANASTQASTQARTQTQRRRTMEDGEDEDDEDYQDFEPTDPAAGTQGQPSAIEKFKHDLETAKTRYQSYSMAARYAQNNDYINFKRVVHDAEHHDDGVPLANPSEWFPEEGERPAPGVTTRRARAEEGDADSDDDIAVSKATISTKCPLTLQEFKNPLTSTKCPHSFEKEAILQMISQAQARPVNGGRPEEAVQCPVSGCSKLLTKGDLQVDNVLVRKIKRIQEAARLEEEDDEEDEGGVPGTQRGATFIVDDEDGADVDDIVEGRVRSTQVKGEPGGSGVRASQGGRRAGGGVVDLAGSSSDEAEEGDEEEEE